MDNNRLKKENLMNTGKYYWDRKIEETKKIFATRPEWMKNNDNDYPSAAFIKGLIEEYKPKNILEIGTAASWAAYYMLDEAIKYDNNVKLTSIDAFDILYFDNSKKVGAAFFEMKPDFINNWNLKNKTYPIDYLINCNEKFDFVFIDANHKHPWACLDFLSVLPHLAKNAVVVFHDVNLNQITIGLMSGERHPSGTVNFKDREKGPYILYNTLKDLMTISYDEITPNIAALEVKNVDKMLSKIYCALQVDWERCYQNERDLMFFYTILLKYVNFVEKYFGDEWAEKFAKTFFDKYKAVFNVF